MDYVNERVHAKATVCPVPLHDVLNIPVHGLAVPNTRTYLKPGEKMYLFAGNCRRSDSAASAECKRSTGYDGLDYDKFIVVKGLHDGRIRWADVEEAQLVLARRGQQ